MKYTLIYIALFYVVACADSVEGDQHSPIHRFYRALFWPWTVTNWFTSQNCRLHRLLNILWVLLVSGWLISLMADRL